MHTISYQSLLLNTTVLNDKLSILDIFKCLLYTGSYRNRNKLSITLHCHTVVSIVFAVNKEHANNVIRYFKHVAS